MYTTQTAPAVLTPRSFGRAGIQDAVRRHRSAAYLSVAFGLSWSVWTAMALGGSVVIPGGSTTHFPGLFGPMIAAFVITAIADGHSGLRDLVSRMVRWRVPLRWYAFAFIPSALFLAGAAIVAASGGEAPTLADLERYSGLPVMALPSVALLAFLGNGFGEEVGWRGFMHPTLRRDKSFLATCVAVAAAWALWHLPSFWVIETYRMMGLAIVPVFVIGLGSGAIVFGWLYERSGSSILIVALAHLSLNMASATEAGRGLPQVLATVGIVAWAALIVVGEIRGAGGFRRSLAGAGRRSTAALLHTRLGRGLARTVTVVTYRGRVSGRTLRTPVEYVREGSMVTILVADPGSKQWWRNVAADGDVHLLLDGVERAGRATVLESPAALDALEAYTRERPRAARVAADAVAVIVELTDERR